MPISARTGLLTLIGVALVGGLAFTAFRTEPLSVELAEIATGDLTVTVDAEGHTRIREIYEVSSPIAGTLLRMPLVVGDPVEAGKTVVAEVEPVTAPLLDARSRAEAQASLHEAEASIRFAEAEITRTRADLVFAEAEFRRTEALVNSGTASLTRLEDANLQLEQAKAAVASAEARLAMAQASYERADAVLAEPVAFDDASACCVTLRAPADGVVLSIENVSARPVVPSEKLLSVGDPSDLEVVVDLLSSDATRLAIGADARLERWGGPEALPATLRRIEPRARTVVSALGIEEQRVDAILDITAPRQDWAGLGDGFAVFVRIEEWKAEGVPLVPLSAVFQRDGGWYTFVEEDGVAREREIEIGRRDGRRAVILSGLEPGERVVTHPPDTIADGAPITERTRF